jgi:hypothetical protein
MGEKPLKGSFLALAFSALVILGNGCSLFEPREPEQPTQSGDHFDQPGQPSTVISNLNYAITERNVSNYMKCFVDTTISIHPFKFNPSADATNLVAWNLADERSYFVNLTSRIGRDGYSNLQLTEADSITTADSKTYQYQYSLAFAKLGEGLRTVSGHMELKLAVDNGFWSIYEWSDFKDIDTTWSRLRLEFQ